MADAQKLVELGMVPAQAYELVRQMEEMFGDGSVEAMTHEARLTRLENEMGDTIATDQST